MKRLALEPDNKAWKSYSEKEDFVVLHVKDNGSRFV